MYYSPSGKMPPMGILILLFFILFAFPLISIAYTFISWFIPYIYIKFFITVGFGLAMSFIINFGVKVGKIRNPQIVKWMVIIGAILAIYIHWSLYCSLLINAGESHEYGSLRHGYNFTETTFNKNLFLGLLSSPSIVFELISSLYKSGTFSIFGFAPKGFLLAFFWLTELLIILGIPYLISEQASEPFSEKNNSWMKNETLDKKSNYILDIDKTKSELENNDFNFILNPDFKENLIYKYSTLKIYSSEGDQNQYLTLINNIMTEEKGKESIKEDFVVQKLFISKPTLQDIKEIYN
jgi:hypothetical protein